MSKVYKCLDFFKVISRCTKRAEDSWSSNLGTPPSTRPQLSWVQRSMPHSTDDTLRI